MAITQPMLSSNAELIQPHREKNGGLTSPGHFSSFKVQIDQSINYGNYMRETINLQIGSTTTTKTIQSLRNDAD